MQRNGQPIRPDGPERHLIEKQGTPTMGGVLILTALTVSTLLWADLRNGYVWAVLLLTLGYGALGFADDYIKLAQASNFRGLSGARQADRAGGARSGSRRTGYRTLTRGAARHRHSPSRCSRRC